MFAHWTVAQELQGSTAAMAMMLQGCLESWRAADFVQVLHSSCHCRAVAYEGDLLAFWDRRTSGEHLGQTTQDSSEDGL